jgi:hypothetical protein
MAASSLSLQHPRLSSGPLVRRIDGTVVLCGALILTLVLALSVAAALWLKSELPRPPAAALFQIGDLTIRVPGGWVSEAWRAGSFGAPSGSAAPLPVRASTVQLSIPFGELSRGGETRHAQARVHVALSLSDGSMAPADRPAQLYARFLAPEATSIEGGLIRRAFRAGTPYENEEFYLAPDGRAFAARCLTAAGGEGLATACMTELRLGKLDLRVRFAPDLLDAWEDMATALRRGFGPASGRAAP